MLPLLCVVGCCFSLFIAANIKEVIEKEEAEPIKMQFTLDFYLSFEGKKVQ